MVDHPTVLSCRDMIIDSGHHLVHDVRKQRWDLARELLLQHLDMIFIRKDRRIENILRLDSLGRHHTNLSITRESDVCGETMKTNARLGRPRVRTILPPRAS